ncbi:unnamed protein product [Tetraodon nigroviridis]|uniref:(spotted green pufferfish) hypothetical protein n=1 Tax=Tetraodon nigroviridis TaxID=99883 RepID=Q4SNN0_TETNG|nr:unnamed protein product [Tetraodon nigroviridis]
MATVRSRWRFCRWDQEEADVFTLSTPVVLTVPSSGQGRSESPVYTNLQELKITQSALPPAPSGSPLHILGDWETYKDQNGRHFYYNRSTQERTWKPPRAKDVSTGSSRLDRHSTGESSEPLSSEDTCFSTYSSQSDSQYGSPPRGWSEEMDEHGHTLYISEHTNEKWLKHVDEQGRPYYYSADGSRSEWELPKYNHSPPQPSGDVTKTRSLDRKHVEPIVLKWRHSTFVPELGDKPSEKCGVLNVTKITEHGKKVRKNWTSSWTVLQGSTLLFAKSQGGGTSWFGGSQSKPEFTVDLRGGSVEWASKDKSSKKHVIELKTRQGTELLIQSENDGVVSEWFRMLQDAISTHVSGSGLGAWWRSTDQPPSAGRVVSLFQAWESDEAIEEDMPESPVEKHDKDKEHRDAKKSRVMKSSTSMDSSDNKKTRHKLKKFLTRRPTLQAVRDKGYIKGSIKAPSRRPPWLRLTFSSGSQIRCSAAAWPTCATGRTPRCPPLSSCASTTWRTQVGAGPGPGSWSGCRLLVLVLVQAPGPGHHMLCPAPAGLCVDGLYRVSGNLAIIQKLRYTVDRDEKVSLQDGKWEDIHVITGALKMYFRELPEPLFTYALFHDFVSAIKITDFKHRVQAIRDLVKQLPKPNHDTMQALFKHLRKVIDHGEENRMTTQSVAIVFGPTLLRPEIETFNMAVHMVYQNQIVELILHEYESIFGR